MGTKRVKVLLIEDNPGDARLIHEMLADVQGANFDLEHAGQLSVGLEHMDRGGIQLVLLDLSLPDSHGLDTFAQARAKAPDLPIVVLTGLDDEALALEAVRLGAQDYLVKAQADGNLLVRSMRYAIERKLSQQKLQELYREERRLRREREAEINKRADFTRALVHELKTPLTSIMASSELLADELPDGTLRRLASNLHRGASNLNKRIDELLDVARGELGMLNLNCSQVDVLALLHCVAYDMSSLASREGQSLVLDLPRSLPPVWADEERLQQVVVNLLSNAFKFTPQGGKISLSAAPQNGKVVVHVEDTGSGMSFKEQQHLFEPYHRLETDREHLGGLGLGLSLCKTLVELHGGRIWVSSRRGKGSTFSFSIPVANSGQKRELQTGR